MARDSRSPPQPLPPRAGFRIGRNPATGGFVYVPIAVEPPADAAPPGDTIRVDSGPADPSVLRGPALVDAALAHDRRKSRRKRVGATPDDLAAIDLAGRALPPSMARWLAADRMFRLGPPRPLLRMLDEEVGPWAEAFAPLAQRLTGPVVVFEGWGSDSRRFLYLGCVDEHGEYPVFTLDTDDTPFACLNGPLDVWLAQQVGFLPTERWYGDLPPAYEPCRRAFARGCFGGAVVFSDFAFSSELAADAP